jgi:hypothetical protein
MEWKGGTVGIRGFGHAKGSLEFIFCAFEGIHINEYNLAVLTVFTINQRYEGTNDTIVA